MCSLHDIHPSGEQKRISGVRKCQVHIRLYYTQVHALQLVQVFSAMVWGPLPAPKADKWARHGSGWVNRLTFHLDHYLVKHREETEGLRELQA